MQIEKTDNHKSIKKIFKKNRSVKHNEINFTNNNHANKNKYIDQIFPPAATVHKHQRDV